MNEMRRFVNSKAMDMKGYVGIILAHYSFQETYSSTLYDQSIYQKRYSFTPSSTASDNFYWTIEDVTSNLQSSSEVEASTNNLGGEQIFSQDKSLYFSGAGGITLSNSISFGSEHTFELCYYLKFVDIDDSDVVFKATGFS